MAWARQMRVKMSGDLGASYPETAQVLIEHFERRCSDRGLIALNFQVYGLPPSLNHQYERRSAFCKQGDPGAFQDKQGRWRRTAQELKPEAHDWRANLAETMGPMRHRWRPTGVTAAVILLQSPYWLTGRRTIREKDADNLVKPILDAVQSATNTPDELHWEVHVFKVQSKRQRTTIFLYDLGDVVEYYY